MFARRCHPIVMSFMLLSPNNMSRLIVDQLSAGSSQMHAHHQHMKNSQSLYTNQPSVGLSQENSMSFPAFCVHRRCIFANILVILLTHACHVFVSVWRLKLLLWRLRNFDFQQQQQWGSSRHIQTHLTSSFLKGLVLYTFCLIYNLSYMWSNLYTICF